MMRPLLYRDLAPWYRLVDPPEDHTDDVERYFSILAPSTAGSARTLLELGAGAGHNAVHLKRYFHCTLTDLSPEMRALSQELNPECEHLPGDMRNLRLGRTFDAVLVHDAIMYMVTREDLLAAAQTAFVHTRPGGTAIFHPDCVRETFREGCEMEGGEASERSARFLMWTWDPDPRDETYCVDFAFLLRDGTQMQSAHDRHVEGLFSRAVWMETLAAAGFQVESVPGDEEGNRVELFLCRKRP